MIIKKYARAKPTNFNIPNHNIPPLNINSLNAVINVLGSVAIIPAIIIKLIPLPIPF